MPYGAWAPIPARLWPGALSLSPGRARTAAMARNSFTKNSHRSAKSSKKCLQSQPKDANRKPEPASIQARYGATPFDKKIPKPRGEPGRAPPRGYNTQELIGLGNKVATWNGIVVSLHYENIAICAHCCSPLQRVTHDSAKKYLIAGRVLSAQDDAVVVTVCFKVFPW